MVRLVLTFLLFLSTIGCGTSNSYDNRTSELQIKNWAYQLQDINSTEIANSKFDLVVIDSEIDKEKVEQIKKSGKLVLAYISIGEAEDYRFYWDNEWKDNPPPWLGEENPEWEGNYAVKYWYPEWKEIIRNYIDKILKEGFQGLYLDKVDEFEYWSENGYPEEKVAIEMVNFISEISKYCRDKLKTCIIIPQNGERLLLFKKEHLLNIVSGWAVEDLFYNGIEPKSAEEIKERVNLLSIVKISGKPVLSVDYVDDGSGYSCENLERIEDYLEKARKYGFIPYVARSDRELDELITITIDIDGG